MISDEVEGFDRSDALLAELAERVDDLYEDEDLRVEDRPLGAVMAGLACGLGLSLSPEWRRWSPGWPGVPRPARPAGDAASVRVERDRRRDAATAEVERAFTEIDPARIPGIRAGLAVRLQEADMIECLDTETTHVVADRLCRSLGIDRLLRFEPPAPDTG